MPLRIVSEAGADATFTSDSNALNSANGVTDGTGQSIDEISLDDLIGGVNPVVMGLHKQSAQSTFKAFVTNGAISIQIPEYCVGKTMGMLLFDLRGRLIMSKTIDASKVTAANIYSDAMTCLKQIGSGLYWKFNSIQFIWLHE